MALFSDLLSRLGPKALASRLNIAESTARRLNITSLARFPRVTTRARELTATIKVNTLTRAGLATTEANRFRRSSFATVNSIRQRTQDLVRTIALNRNEFKANKIGLDTSVFIDLIPEDAVTEAMIREGMRLSPKRIKDMERDSV